MTIRTNTPTLLDNPPVPVQAKLAAAWTSLMFFVIYIAQMTTIRENDT